MASVLSPGKRLDQLKVAELKDELRKRGLSPSGVKKDLVERLRSRLSQEASEQPEGLDPASTGPSNVPQEPASEPGPVANLAEEAFTDKAIAAKDAPPQLVAEATVGIEPGDAGAQAVPAVTAGHDEREEGKPAPGEPAPEVAENEALNPTATEADTVRGNTKADGKQEIALGKAGEDPDSGQIWDVKAVPDSDFPPTDGPADGPAAPVIVSEAGLEPEEEALPDAGQDEAEKKAREGKLEGEPAEETKPAEEIKGVDEVKAAEESKAADESKVESKAADESKAAGESKAADVSKAAEDSAPATEGASMEEDKEQKNGADVDVKMDDATLAATAGEVEDKQEKAADDEGTAGPQKPGADAAAVAMEEGAPAGEQAKGEDEEMVAAEGGGNEGGLLVQLEAPGLELPEVEEQETQKAGGAERVGQKRLLGRGEPHEEEGKAQDASKRIRRWNSGREGANEEADKGVKRSVSMPTPGSGVGKEGAPAIGQPGRPLANRGGPALRPGGAAANGQAPKERTVPPSREPPSASVRVDNLVRPFPTKHLDQLLARTGKVEKFWIDQIKTHCYATYSSLEEAAATREALYNLQWPEQGGKLLAVRFVPGEEVDAKLGKPNGAPAGAAPAPAQAPAAGPGAAPGEAAPGLLRPAQQVLPPPPPRDLEPELPTLDDLFRKTKSKPELYFLPLTDEQVAAKVSTQQKPLVRMQS